MKHLWRSALVLAQTTLLEAIRNRVLMVALAFAVGLIALSITTAAVSIGEKARLIVDVGLASASAFGSLVAVTLTLTSFGRELQLRTAYPVLARPIPRSVFVLGKYLGLLCTMAIVVALMLAATALAVLLFGETLPAAFWPSLWLALLEMGVVVALALFFSCFTSSVLAAIYSVGTLVAGNLAADIAALAAKAADKTPLGSLALRGIYYVLPHLNALSLRTQAANGLAVPPAYVLVATLYAAAYAAAALLLAMLLFGRRRAV
jgi:Cu-processing system permease protein